MKVTLPRTIIVQWKMGSLRDSFLWGTFLLNHDYGRKGNYESPYLKNHVTALVTVTWVKGSLIDLSHLSIIILVSTFLVWIALSLVASEKHPDLFWRLKKWHAIHYCVFC